MKAVRTNVMLPADLLKEIDRVAGARRRSAFLVEAAHEKLSRLRFDRAVARGFGAWKDKEHPELRTDTDHVRYLTRIRASTTARVRRRIGHG
jgi:hypothetical protein